MPIFFVYVDLVKIGLEIMLSVFVQEKRTFLTLKNRIFHSPKNRIFPKGLTHAFDQKCQFLLYLDLIKIRLEIMLKDFAEKRETFWGYKKQNFQQSKNSHFFKGPMLLVQKMPILYLFVVGQNKTRNNT